MVVDRLTSMQRIEIWQPRWKDRVVMIAKYKVGTHNCIVFTKTKSLQGEFYLSGEEIRKHPLDTNGKLECYAVPMDKMEKLER